MAVRNVVFVVLLVASAAVCKPRDSTAVHANNQIDSIEQNESQISVKEEAKSAEAPNAVVPLITARIPCPYEEATDDATCFEHCAPKGYSYGICVSKTCSCI